jgi:hypothetical protein
LPFARRDVTDDWEIILRQNLLSLLLLLRISLPLNVTLPSLSFFREEGCFALHLERFRIGFSRCHGEDSILVKIECSYRAATENTAARGSRLDLVQMHASEQIGIPND